MAIHLDTNDLQQNNDNHLAKPAWAFILLGIPLIFGGISLYLGRDLNWDLRNYHYYNVYAFLNNRLGYDIAPAQLQTYINPFFDLPFYFLTQRFHSSVAGYFLGFLHGFNISLLFIVFWQMSLIQKRWYRFLVGMALCFASAFGPAFVSELGNTMNDNLVSLFVLTAITLLLASTSRKEDLFFGKQQTLIAAAGVIMGLGVGFKTTTSFFALSSAFAMLILYPDWPTRIKNFIIYGFFGLVGGVLSSGYWCWEMYTRFGNPLMPYYNDIFKSPYMAPEPFIFTPFLPKATWEYFVWPILFSLDSYRVIQIKFTDVRFAILYVTVLAWPVTLAARKVFRRNSAPAADEALFHPIRSTFLLVFCLMTYLYWLVQFSTYRYVIALELLVPLCFLIVLSHMIRSRKAQIAIAISALAVTFIVYKPANWIRASWTPSYIEVDTSRFERLDNGLVVMLGDVPTSYVIPEFPKDYRFIRPDSNFIEIDEPYQFSRMMKTIIANHQGPIFILYYVKDDLSQLGEKLSKLNLQPKTGKCFKLKVNTPDEFEMCRVYRQ